MLIILFFFLMESQPYGGCELRQEGKKQLVFQMNTQNFNSVLSSKMTKNEEFCWKMRGMLDQITLEMH